MHTRCLLKRDSRTRLLQYLALFAVMLLNFGCTALTQQNIATDQQAMSGHGGGVITGSVTAPFILHYHDEVYFHYRTVGSGKGTKGVLTSGTQFPSLLPWLPSCNADGLDQQCGRLFAINLPAGIYVIDHIVFDTDHFAPESPAMFTVEEGKAVYLGNLHVAYCMGLVRSTRGNILGADVSIRDSYERDMRLLRDKYNSLESVSIERDLLEDHAWRWRVSYRPYDWGSCTAGSDITPWP